MEFPDPLITAWWVLSVMAAMIGIITGACLVVVLGAWGICALVIRPLYWMGWKMRTWSEGR